MTMMNLRMGKRDRAATPTTTISPEHDRYKARGTLMSKWIGSSPSAKEEDDVGSSSSSSCNKERMMLMMRRKYSFLPSSYYWYRLAAVVVLLTAMNIALSLFSYTSTAFHALASCWATSSSFSSTSSKASSSITATTTTTSPPKSTIFYNIFIDPRDTANGIRIIKEQTQQMFQLLTDRKQPIPILYYNMIGYNYSEPFCPSTMTCHLNRYYSKAFEEVTIQNLYDYCQHHPRDIVYYLHNKGSYTPSNRKNNERWRVSLTDFLFRKGTTYFDDDDDDAEYNNINNNNNNNDASSSTSAQHPQQQQQQRRRGCNVAGESWKPHNFWHFPGNFWVAKCSYVRKLLPPKDYDIASSKMVLDLLKGTNAAPNATLYCLASYLRTMYKVQPKWANLVVGMNRYIYEKWIASHPDLVPCDAYDTFFNTTFHMFDAIPNMKTWSHLHDAYKYDWKRLYGRLYEFQYLYDGRVPPNTSFFWKYYRGTETPLLPKECTTLRKSGAGGNNNQRITAYPVL